MNLRWPSTVLILIPLLFACSRGDEPLPAGETLYQYSTIKALLAGLYDGELTIAAAAAQGDMGLGTVNGIDGELIALDGKFYAVRDDGQARELRPEDKVPFIVLARFAPETKVQLPDDVDFKTLKGLLDQVVANPNGFQAFRVDGTFSAVKVRSEPKQTPPYRPLAEVMAAQQVTFDLADVEGTMIGFRMPDYMAGVNVPGYHFHFITNDRTRGGHVLEFELSSGTAKVDELTDFEMDLPRTEAFRAIDLGEGHAGDLEAVEQR